MKYAFFVLLYGVAACLAAEAPHVVCLTIFSLSTVAYIIQVNVGNSGSFFDPAVIAAFEGDTVSFVFSGL